MLNRDYIWQEIANENGYESEADMLMDMISKYSLNKIGEILGFSDTAIKFRLTKHNLEHLIRGRGGNNFEPYRNKIWNRRAIRLGFQNEIEMLSKNNDLNKLHELLILDILKNESLTVTKTVLGIQTLRRRYQKYGIAYGA